MSKDEITVEQKKVPQKIKGVPFVSFSGRGIGPQDHNRYEVTKPPIIISLVTVDDFDRVWSSIRHRDVYRDGRVLLTIDNWRGFSEE